jgi:CheY-like chemotaxis protein
MGGVELARRIRETRPGIDVVFMSGFPDARGQQTLKAELVEGARLLDKPFSHAQLLTAVAGQ